jgi:hypothetical protein
MPELLASTAALVFLRAIQQQNVIHGNYILAAITPFAIATAEVASIVWIVDRGWPAIPWVGAGGAIGVTAGMWIYRRLRHAAHHA